MSLFSVGKIPDTVSVRYHESMKRLYKSSTDKKLDGVCAGIADYANVDPTLVRVGYAVLTVLSGVFPGLILYVVLAVIMPRQNTPVA